MFETSNERKKMLKNGLTPKQMEKIYIEGNSFKIVLTPILIDMVEIEFIERKNDKKSFANCQMLPGCIQSSAEEISCLC